MSVAYFDCFAGAGGDMIVASLLDAGCDRQALIAALGKLNLSGYAISADQASRCGITATKFDVELSDSPAEQPHRGLKDCLELIEQADLPARASQRAAEIFTRLARAEAAVHGCGIEEVHFHEVGAVDSIIDIVGSCLALELLDVDRVFCSVIPVGTGTITCEHGTLPVPSPATAELLRGHRARPGPIAAEMTTPTAAAILTTLAGELGHMPEMTVNAIGYGAGTRDSAELPNLLRVFVGELSESWTADSVVELTVNLDDCTGEIIADAIEALLSSGCLDAWAAPIVMKKSRPAWQLSALCDPADVQTAEDVLLSHTTALGVRRRVCGRTKLAREFHTVVTEYGPIRIKLGKRREAILTASPEFSDCQSAAQAHNVPARVVMDAARTAFDASDPDSPQKGESN